MVNPPPGFNLVAIEKERILRKASEYLKEEPRTVTADTCERSEGGRHDFYSEGDYWWPDPAGPELPYIRRDGESNPNAFFAHRHSMVRLSEHTGTLTAAYEITGDEGYATHAIDHLKAWFIDEGTRMNPNLLYAQAIKGLHSGRGIGIIDTLHLCEAALGAKILSESGAFWGTDFDAVKGWFRQYLTWINMHPYGREEKKMENNHGVCWSMQAAAFATLVGDTAMLEWIRNEFKCRYIPRMMDEDGSLPAELNRTKPYGYSLFTIDALAGVAEFASTPQDDLWTFELSDGRGMRKGLEFIVLFIKDKSSWPREPDVMDWNEWPARHPSLLLAAYRLGKPEYPDIWKDLEPDPTTFEVLRNLPLRHPLLWLRFPITAFS